MSKTRKVRVVENTLFVQITETKKGRDGKWRQVGIIEHELEWIGSMYEPPQPKSVNGLDLEKFREGND